MNLRSVAPTGQQHVVRLSGDRDVWHSITVEVVTGGNRCPQTLSHSGPSEIPSLRVHTTSGFIGHLEEQNDSKTEAHGSGSSNSRATR